MMIRGKLVHADGSNLHSDDNTSVVNNLLHSLFSQCIVTRNAVSISASKDLYYNYRVYLEMSLTYGQDASPSHLTNAFWYLDDADLLATYLVLG
jgi:hypothetical protein